MEENIGCVRKDVQIRKALQQILEASAELEAMSDPRVVSLARRITAAAQTLKE